MSQLNLAKYHLVLQHVDVDKEGHARYKDGRPLKQWKGSGGYWFVTPCIKGKLYPSNVHTLVAFRWLGDPPEGKTDVSHLDESRENNRVENLAWVTHKENSNMPLWKERQKDSYPFEKRSAANDPKKKRVGQYDLQGNLIAEFESGWAAARATGLSHGGISGCCRGRQHCLTYKGFIWRYL